MAEFRFSGLMIFTLALAAFAQQEGDQKAPQKSSRKTAYLNVTVVKETSGKPVKNAEIVLHPIDKDGRQRDESLELKSHEDGKAEISGIPFGKMRIQVIARGFRTYGEDFEINQANMVITVKLQMPKDQFSIYK